MRIEWNYPCPICDGIYQCNPDSDGNMMMRYHRFAGTRCSGSYMRVASGKSPDESDEESGVPLQEAQGEGTQ